MRLHLRTKLRTKLFIDRKLSNSKGSRGRRTGFESPFSHHISGKIKLNLDSRLSFIFYRIVLWFLLTLYLGACGSFGSSSNYNYPTGQQQRVLELCALVFTAPYYQYISPSRRVKIKKLRTTSWGFWATFADGRTYKVPISSGLVEGANYYCNYRPVKTACASRNDWDERCKWD